MPPSSHALPPWGVACRGATDFGERAGPPPQGWRRSRGPGRSWLWPGGGLGHREPPDIHAVLRKGGASRPPLHLLERGRRAKVGGGYRAIGFGAALGGDSRRRRTELSRREMGTCDRGGLGARG